MAATQVVDGALKAIHVPLHVRIGHAERIDADADILLAITQRRVHISKNLIHIGVSHGIAAN